MAPVATINDYKARLAGLPPEKFCGSLLWFSITSRVNRDTQSYKRSGYDPIRATVEQFDAWFTDLGIDRKFLPPQISKINAFRKASSTERREYVIDKNKGLAVKLRVEEIAFTEEKVIRHVFRDLTDARNQVQVSTRVASLYFYRGARNAAGKIIGAQTFKSRVLTNMVVVGLDGQETGDRMPLPPDEQVYIQQFVDDITTKYEDLCIYLDSNAIRSIVRNIITDLKAISCTAHGSLYFIHATRQDQVDALQELVRRVGQGCQFMQIPLLDTEESRDMLTEAFQTEVEEECYVLLKAITETNETLKAKGNKVTPRLYAGVKAKYDAIVSKSEEYTKILGLSQGRSASALELALDSVFDLADRMEG